ncbi:MAG: alpha/beta hydrolase [Anaerolineales bacterium]|nr:alpha/beta hydrolase [Anaerolineales bacterium]
MNILKNWPFAHPVARLVQDGFFENDGIKLHYVMLGKGPLLVLIHGIPEFWYSWRYQIDELARHFQVVAIDQRGFNKSGKPRTRDGYRVEELVTDIAALVKHLGQDQAVVVGHDAGAWVAWHFAAAYAAMTSRLIILSVPHPNALREELSQRGAQYDASGYARKMQIEGARPLFRVGPIGCLRDPQAAPLYLDAERGTDPLAITAFYQLNYPREPYDLEENMESIAVPTLVIHGRRDGYLLESGHARNARWLSQKPTTVMLDADHFVHQERPREVNQIILDWLK